MRNLYIDAIVYNNEGNILSGVYAWPEGSPENQTYIIGNGELLMANVPSDSNIVFSFQGKQVKIPALQIGSKVYLEFTNDLGEVVINATPSNPNTSKANYGLFGVFLGLGLVAGYALINKSQKVNI